MSEKQFWNVKRCVKCFFVYRIWLFRIIKKVSFGVTVRLKIIYLPLVMLYYAIKITLLDYNNNYKNKNNDKNNDKNKKNKNDNKNNDKNNNNNNNNDHHHHGNDNGNGNDNDNKRRLKITRRHSENAYLRQRVIK